MEIINLIYNILSGIACIILLFYFGNKVFKEYEKTKEEERNLIRMKAMKQAKLTEKIGRNYETK